tara:strand:- start:1439 stop:1750 length:312 start_codon:yes stop_codon:yes gene_type:complete
MSGGRTKPEDKNTEKGMRTSQRNVEKNNISIDLLEGRSTSLEGRSTSLEGRATTLESSKLQWVSVPASASASGVPGQIAYASGNLYVCVSSNTWQRVAIATWS